MNTACRSEEPVTPESAGSSLETARELLAVGDFGEKYLQAQELLGKMPKRFPDEKRAVVEAAYLSNRTRLDLFLAAWVTNRPELMTTLLKDMNWELEEPIRELKTFQVLLQEIREGFELVERETSDEEALDGKAKKLISFCKALTTLHYVKQDVLYRVFEEEIQPDPELSHLADLVTLSLFQQLMSQQPEGWWRSSVASIIGLNCPKAVGPLHRTLCVPDPDAKTYGQCMLKQEAIKADRRLAAAETLNIRCDLPGDGPAIERLLATYQTRLDRLTAADLPLTRFLKPQFESWRSGFDELSAPLKELFPVKE